MIWSFIKIAVFFGLIAALAYGSGFVMDTGGYVTVAFGGYEIRKTPIEALIILVLLFAAVFILFKLAGFVISILKFVNGDETALSRYFDRNREKKGYEALGDSVIALAAGDGRTAIAKAAKAEKLISRPEITTLVNAQAAQLNGDKALAETHFKTLLSDERTRFVGVQGLLRQKLDSGDTETALRLAEKAFAINPRHDQTLQTLFELQSGNNDWGGARETLQARVKAKALPKDVGKRRDAVLSLADAFAQMEAGQTEAARASAAKANKIAPGLIPAAALHAQLLIEDGSRRKAGSILKKAWETTPHPDLAATFAAIAPDETHEARLKRFKSFLKLRPNHVETQLLEAELHLANEDFPAARKAISDLAETDPTARSLSIMAAIERGMGAEEAVVSGWLAKALSAPRGDAWICESCNHIHGAWEPICENCAHFDTLSWKRVPPSEDAKTMAAAMLPLIVGQLEKEQGEDVAPPQDDLIDATPEDADTQANDAIDDTKPIVVDAVDAVEETVK